MNERKPKKKKVMVEDKCFLFNRLFFLCMILALSSCSSVEQEIKEHIWVVETIVEKETKEDICRCFKSELLLFNKNNRLAIPGFEVPFDDGKYSVLEKEHLITFSELKDCYFNSEFKFKIKYNNNIISTIELEDENIVIIGVRKGFENGGINIGFMNRLLDSTSWNTTECQMARSRLCK